MEYLKYLVICTVITIIISTFIIVAEIRKETFDKLDTVIENWNGCKMMCEQDGSFHVGDARASMLYAYDVESGTWKPLRWGKVKAGWEILDALCRWVEWMDAKPGDQGLAPMLAKVCGKAD